jgi:hypothetical protein
VALEGDHTRAEGIVADVRARHTGRSRNPFNEAECGNHYARSMASFGLLHAWSHLVVDASIDTVTVDPLPGRWPVVVGERVGHVVVSATGSSVTAEYEAVSGRPFEVTVRC